MATVARDANNVNPVTEGLVPVIAETVYVLGLAYPVMVPVPPSDPDITMFDETARAAAEQVNCPAIPPMATLLRREFNVQAAEPMFAK
jgi:hypothetical protein